MTTQQQIVHLLRSLAKKPAAEADSRFLLHCFTAAVFLQARSTATARAKWVGIEMERQKFRDDLQRLCAEHHIPTDPPEAGMSPEVSHAQA